MENTKRTTKVNLEMPSKDWQKSVDSRLDNVDYLSRLGVVGASRPFEEAISDCYNRALAVEEAALKRIDRLEEWAEFNGHVINGLLAELPKDKVEAIISEAQMEYLESTREV